MMSAKSYDWTGFNDRERIFCHEYLIDQNSAQAAIRAGYSEKTANNMGYKLLKKGRIKNRVEEMLAVKMEKAGVTAERIINELALIGFANVTGAFNPDGSMKSFPDMPEDVQRVLSGVDVDELFEGKGPDRERIGFTKKIRMWDKIKALELLGKNLKMWTDKVEVDDNRPKVVRRDLTGKKKAGQ